MKNFDLNFAEAVKMLLEDKDEKKSSDSRRPATEMIIWRAGPGRWSEVIRGLKQDADNITYEEALSKSAAVGSKGAALMTKLGVTKKMEDKDMEGKDPTLAAGRIILQALSNAAMKEMYDKPVGGGGTVSIKVIPSTEDKDVKSGEGVSPRNATVYIHLTLIAAYNSRFLEIDRPIKIETANGGVIKIRKA